VFGHWPADWPRCRRCEGWSIWPNSDKPAAKPLFIRRMSCDELLNSARTRLAKARLQRRPGGRPRLVCLSHGRALAAQGEIFIP
jgi:hypothetical protein